MPTLTYPLTMDVANLFAVADLRFERRPTPVPGEGEALVRIEASGICGSDLPRVLSKGTYRFPTIPGNELGVGGPVTPSATTLLVITQYLADSLTSRRLRGRPSTRCLPGLPAVALE